MEAGEELREVAYVPRRGFYLAREYALTHFCEKAFVSAVDCGVREISTLTATHTQDETVSSVSTPAPRSVRPRLAHAFLRGLCARAILSRRTPGVAGSARLSMSLSTQHDGPCPVGACVSLSHPPRTSQSHRHAGRRCGYRGGYNI